jgi:hypothetical protein
MVKDLVDKYKKEIASASKGRIEDEAVVSKVEENEQRPEQEKVPVIHSRARRSLSEAARAAFTVYAGAFSVMDTGAAPLDEVPANGGADASVMDTGPAPLEVPAMLRDTNRAADCADAFQVRQLRIIYFKHTTYTR